MFKQSHFNVYMIRRLHSRDEVRPPVRQPETCARQDLSQLQYQILPRQHLDGHSGTETLCSPPLVHIEKSTGTGTAPSNSCLIWVCRFAWIGKTQPKSISSGTDDSSKQKTSLWIRDVRIFVTRFGWIDHVFLRQRMGPDLKNHIVPSRHINQGWLWTPVL